MVTTIITIYGIVCLILALIVPPLNDRDTQQHPILGDVLYAAVIMLWPLVLAGILFMKLCKRAT
jgi:hypothetical protein